LPEFVGGIPSFWSFFFSFCFLLLDNSYLIIQNADKKKAARNMFPQCEIGVSGVSRLCVATAPLMA